MDPYTTIGCRVTNQSSLDFAGSSTYDCAGIASYMNIGTLHDGSHEFLGFWGDHYYQSGLYYQNFYIVTYE